MLYAFYGPACAFFAVAPFVLPAAFPVPLTVASFFGRFTTIGSSSSKAAFALRLRVCRCDADMLRVWSGDLVNTAVIEGATLSRVVVKSSRRLQRARGLRRFFVARRVFPLNCDVH